MIHNNLYSKVISLENLFIAFYEFRRGKRNKKEVAEFELNLEENIFSLHNKLANFQYQHRDYFCFKISDPKPRIIHKAHIEDRIIHQAVFRILYPIFDKTFIFDSYSSRLQKGTHRAMTRLISFAKKESRNYKNPCYALKFDIQKFFHSIDHIILLKLLQSKIRCRKTIWLLRRIIDSFSTEKYKGIPLGNVTSQLFANIYLSPLDYYVKYILKEKYYIRFCDDFIIVKNNADFGKLIDEVDNFCRKNLQLSIKIDKLQIRKLKWGFDFLGYVVLPYHSVLRIKTRKRMFRKINLDNINSYLGLIKHCNGFKLQNSINILDLK